MTQEIKTGVTRREFIKTVGAVGAAVAGMPALARAAEEQPVPRRKLGKSGVEVSVLSLGGMLDTLGNQLLLKQTLNWGVNYWDTAEGYGNGLSEEGFGRYFSRNPGSRDSVFLVTKLKDPGNNLTDRLEKSLKRLHTDYVDMFLIHAISAFSDMDDKTRKWAEKMKADGKIKLFGFSSHSNMEKCMADAAKEDWIDAVMVSYNFRLMHEPKMKEAMAACAKAGIGVVAMKTQGGGPVTADNEAEIALGGRFLQKGFTDKQARLKAVWEDQNIASLCSHMPTLAILSANVAAARDMTALAAEDYRALQEYALQTKSGYCAGCTRICGGATGLPVGDVMRCLMYHKDYDDPAAAREVFASLPAKTRQDLAMADYAQAEAACPQGLAIGELMREAGELLA